MKFKRFFSSISLNKFYYSNCRLYNRKTKICKINNLNALENRLNEEICGLDAKKLWLLDKTNLIKSNKFREYCMNFTILSISPIPFAFYFDIYCIFTSIISIYFADICIDISDDYKKKYFKDNDIDEE